VSTPAILLVDDESNVLRALKRLLKNEPYEVLTASSAEQALGILADTPVALLVTDYRMPGMDGVELVKIARKQYPDTIRIILTGHSNLGAAISAINEGNVYSFLSKPWDDNHFKKTIADTLNEYEFLRRREEKLKKHEERKKDFASMTMHELRTPLTLIISCAQILKDEQEMNSENRMALHDILYQASRRLHSLVDDVLGIVEEEQRRPLRKSEVSLNDVVGQVENEVRPFVRKRQQTLTCHLAEELPRLKAEERKMWQVVMNLVMNAIRFTPDGGVITVETRLVGNSIQLAVSDTGIGIPAEERENIFEKFYEVRESIRHSSGTIEFMSGALGLGLSTAKLIVERHGGKIFVESEVGKGSTFTVELSLEGEFCKQEADAALR
jgi:signal transduction histidine kinase